MVQVERNPGIAFPHAAMVTLAAATTPWLRPLASAMSSLGQLVSGNNDEHREAVKTQQRQARKTRTGRGRNEDRRSNVDNTTAAAHGTEIVPRFVTPVWESCSNPLHGDFAECHVTNESVDRQHLHLADVKLFANSAVDTNGEKFWLLYRLVTHGDAYSSGVSGFMHLWLSYALRVYTCIVRWWG